MSRGRAAMQHEDRQRAGAIASRFLSIQHGWALGLLCAGLALARSRLSHGLSAAERARYLK
jgi:hypothetical protein